MWAASDFVVGAVLARSRQKDSRAASNLHRNVIFRNAEVPDRVVSYFEERRPQG